MQKWSQLNIYCFSGTGNTLSASHWIADIFKANNISTSVKLIDRALRVEKASLESKQLVGFAFPTHGFNLPWYMLKFIWLFPKAKNNSKEVFIVNTRAGAKVYKIFTPGISGIAILLPVIILAVKGYSIRGILPLDPPSNWISLHPGFRQKVALSIMERCKKQTTLFAQKLLAGKRPIHPKSYLSLPVDLALFPITMGYLVLGRFFLSKTFYASSTCNGCGICENRCPVKAIEIRNSRPYWKFRCESCMRCMNICPKKSINTIHLYAALIIWLISSFPISSMTTSWLISLSPAILNYFSNLISLTVLSLFSLPALWLSYHVVHSTNRVKFINAVLTYTSLTKYWRRYLAPGTKASSFKNGEITSSLPEIE